MADPAGRYARVCVDVAPAHLDRPFDYRVPEGRALRVGQRVRVPFAGRRRTGWVVGVASEPEADPARVKDLDAIDGDLTWFDEEDLPVYRWIADRFAGTLADVLRHALPARVAAVEREAAAWRPAGAVPAGRRPPDERLWRDYRAQPLLDALASPRPKAPVYWWRPLPGDDPAAQVADLAARCVASGRGALVLAPDRASRVPEAVLDALGSDAVDLRAERERDRYRAFLRCRLGLARAVVGERSTALAPVRDLGLVVLVDEANPAYKERRAPRHHAREAVLARARFARAVTVLTGDLPSPRLWRLLEDGHAHAIPPPREAERARAPIVEVVDRSAAGAAWRRIGDVTARRIGSAVDEQAAAVVVAARGGEGAALACRSCGARRVCPVCDGSLRPARDAGGTGAWACPACAWTGPAFPCDRCEASETAPLAAGAGRMARELARAHPAAEVTRMEGFDAAGPTRRPAIAVMTRGSVVARPAWLGDDVAAVVALPDADAFLRRASFDAAEDALRLWFAVARWGSRVVLETREPAHPAVQALVRWDPTGFWRGEAPRRDERGYPPAAWLIRVTAAPDAAGAVGEELRASLPEADVVLGPDPSGALLVKTRALRGTLTALTPVRHRWSSEGRKARVDVDPIAG